MSYYFVLIPIDICIIICDLVKIVRFWVSSMHSDIEKTNSLNYLLFILRDNILINLDHSDVFSDSDI